MDEKVRDNNAILDTYKQLSYFEKLILQLKYLTTGYLNVDLLLNAIKTSGIEQFSSNLINKNLLVRTFNRLTQLKLLRARWENKLELVAPIINEMQNSETRQDLQAIVEHIVKFQYSWIDYLKAGICLNNIDAFNRGMVSYQAEHTLRLLSALIDLNDDWVRELHPDIKRYVIALKIDTALDLRTEKVITDNEFEAIRSVVTGFISTKQAGVMFINNVLVEYLVMLGLHTRLAEFANSASNLPTTSAILGIGEFLSGNNAKALVCFDAYLTQIKKMHKSDWLDVYGVFHVLALFKEGCLDKARQIIDLYEKTGSNSFAQGLSSTRRYRASYAMLSSMVDFLENKISEMPNYKRTPFSTSLLDQAVFFLISLWSGADEEDLKDRCNSTLAGHKARFDGLASIARDVLNKLNGNSADFSNAYGIRLSEVVNLESKWEHALHAIDKLLVPQQGTANVQSKRIVWHIAQYGDDVRFEPVEQSRKKNGDWGKGRAINIYHFPDSGSHVTAQDKKIAQNLEHHWYSSKSDRAILAIVGHPYVFMDGKHIEIVSGEPELVVSEKSDSYEVRLSGTSNKASVRLIKETDTRYKAVETNITLAELSSLIGKKLVVPKDGKDKVLDLLQRISDSESQHARLKIRAEIDDDSLIGEPAPSDVTIQLLPSENGLRLKLLVKPFGSANVYLLPGEGSRALLTFRQGSRTKVIRDLEQELKNAAEITGKLNEFIDKTKEPFVFETTSLPNALEVLSVLQQHDGSVEWPKGELFKVAKEVSFEDLKFTVSSSNQWFEFDGQVQVDETQVLEMKNLLGLLSQTKGRFIALNDKSFIALNESFAKKLRELSIVSKDGKIHELGAHMLSDFEEMAGSFSADESWRKHIKKIDFSKKHDPKIPKHLASKLRPYQVEGYKWMSRLCSLGLGCCLADDMGLGKTLQTITLVLEQAVEGPCLVVAPKSVCYVWEEECKKFAPKLNIVRMIEDDKEAREQLIDSLKAMDVLVISYGILPNLEKPLIKKHWQVIILDEAQAIKNFNTKRFKIVTQLKGEKRVALSGTPVENHVSELWNLFYFLNPGFLGNKTTFHEQYIKPIEQTNDPLVKATLKRLVQPFILRRVKEKVLAELPAKTEQTIFIEPSSEEKHFYEALRQTSIQKINEVSLEDNQAKKRLRIFAEITKLKRACCDSSLIDSSIELPNSKLKVFDDLIRELKENNHKVLVFSQYVDYLNIIKSRVEALGFAYQYLDGSTSANERKKAIEKFQSGQSDLFLISLKAGGTGLTLTAANYVIHMDPWWNPAVEDQASARAHRLGQQNPVTVYRLVVKYSIEEKIMEMHKTKRELASSLLEGTDTAAHLTEEDLMKLVLS